MISQTVQPAMITALIRDKGEPVDRLLLAAARELEAKGASVAGAVQHTRPRAGACCDEFSLLNLQTGARHCISQDLGKGSKGCRLDYAALAETIAEIGRGLTPGTDALILNRFGYSETQGGGFRPLIERAVELGIPVLLSVTRAYHAGWQAYSGGLSRDVPATAHSLAQWGDAIMCGSVKVAQDA